MNDPTLRLGLVRRIFNKSLKSAIEKKGLTYAQLHKTTGIDATRMSMLVNFKYCPSEEQKVKLAVALETPIDEIFPEKYDELYEKISPLKREEEVEVKMLQLNSPEVMALEAPDDTVRQVSSDITMEKIRQFLTPKEYDILVYRHDQGLTLEETGKKFGVTRDRIRQIEAKAHDKLRVSGIFDNP